MLKEEKTGGKKFMDFGGEILPYAAANNIKVRARAAARRTLARRGPARCPTPRAAPAPPRAPGAVWPCLAHAPTHARRAAMPR
jgi:hypothetical protein